MAPFAQSQPTYPEICEVASNTNSHSSLVVLSHIVNSSSSRTVLFFYRNQEVVVNQCVLLLLSYPGTCPLNLGPLLYFSLQWR